MLRTAGFGHERSVKLVSRTAAFRLATDIRRAEAARRFRQSITTAGGRPIETQAAMLPPPHDLSARRHESRLHSRSGNWSPLTEELVQAGHSRSLSCRAKAVSHDQAICLLLVIALQARPVMCARQHRGAKPPASHYWTCTTAGGVHFPCMMAGSGQYDRM